MNLPVFIVMLDYQMVAITSSNYEIVATIINCTDGIIEVGATIGWVLLVIWFQLVSPWVMTFLKNQKNVFTVGKKN